MVVCLKSTKILSEITLFDWNTLWDSKIMLGRTFKLVYNNFRDKFVSNITQCNRLKL